MSKACFNNAVDWSAMHHALVVPHDRDCTSSVVFECDDFAFDHPTHGRARQPRSATNESLPIRCRLEWSFDPR